MNQASGGSPSEDAGIDAWDLPGVIGAELAEHVSPTLDIVQRLRESGSVNDAHASVLADVADRLRRIALASQQITRLANGCLRQSRERLDLAQVVQAVVAENERRYAQRGVHIESKLQSIEVVTDPGLLVTLCEVALECALRDGDRVQVWLTTAHWPENAQLTIRTRPHVRTADTSVTASTTLEWIYLRRLALETGAKVRRHGEGEYVEIIVEFPRTVQQHEGLTALQVDGDAHALDATAVAGHRILLITQDEAIAWEVGLTARHMRLMVDVVRDCASAMRFCELDLPDMVILDEAARDDVFEDLRRDILRQNINFPCLEVVQASNVVELGTWYGGATSRVSRSELRRELPSLLTMELAKVF